jgi:hypothetical protein
MIEIARGRKFSKSCRKSEGGNGRAGEDHQSRKRPGLAHQSGLDMNLRFPNPWQQFVETVDGVSIDHAREHVGEVSVGFDAVEFAGFDQRTDDRPTVATPVTACEQMVLAAERHHPFILPMSGRSWKFNTAGIPILAATLASGA